MLSHKPLYVLCAGISLHHLALSLSLDFSPICLHSCRQPSAFPKEKEFIAFANTLKYPPPPPSCSVLFWLCFRGILEELGDGTLQDLQAEKLSSTEVGKNSFPT